MNDIKRCPFCGSFPTTEVRVTQMGGGEDHIDFTVKCLGCDTYKTVRLKINKTCMFFDVRNAMSEALGAWNRRPNNET